MGFFGSVGNSIPGPTTYLFVDGSNFRRYFNETTTKWFGQEVEFDFRKIKVFFKAEKVFYYDCIDDIKTDSETQIDFETRVSLQEKQLNQIREVEGCHVHLGSISGKGKKKRQKEVDVLLTVQMMEHAFRGNMKKAVLLSGDKDFRPLVESLIRLGLFVEVVGDQKHISQDLIHSADSHKRLNLNDYFYWTSQVSSNMSLPTLLSESPLSSVLEPPKIIKSGLFQNQIINLTRYCNSEQGKVYVIDFNHFNNMNQVYLWAKNQKELELYFELVYGKIEWKT